MNPEIIVIPVTGLVFVLERWKSVAIYDQRGEERFRSVDQA
jgi:hypothetical protein